MMHFYVMEPTRKSPRLEAEWQRLLTLIEACEHQRNPRIPSEPNLCEVIGTTRARLRTLLKRAENQGLIWRHVGKGTFAGTRPIVREEAVRDLSVSVDDLFDARALIEPGLAAHAALHATARDIAALNATLAQMQATATFQEWQRLDARLHRLVAVAAHNPLLLLLYDTLRMPLKLGLDSRLEEVYGAPQRPRDDTNHEHSALIEAIASRRADQAKQIMLDHILSVRERLFGPASALP